jgi:hypothetical protein
MSIRPSTIGVQQFRFNANDAMEKLAHSLPPKKLSDNAYKLYGRFTPQVPSGTKGWGAKGELDLDVIHSLGNSILPKSFCLVLAFGV